ncbi:MAG: phosphoribosylformylglycinamidine synthase [Candidatus Pelagibacter sp.]|nr:phosphoribosylformylglycinamidine synthase [Candidatus Pelagibacter sp.]RPG11446.1 MAG: phosphoribosylformylglycinamidine synthase subunit PurS [Pelagibacteraceae bacterium TMED170]
MKFSVKVILKKDVLDPQGKVVHQTLNNMGMTTLKELRQGKYFEIDIDENSEAKAKEKIDLMCKKLLVNLIIEDYTITKI